jgi:hypothetical protein
MLLRCKCVGASSFDFGWAHFGLDEAHDCNAGVALRFFMIAPFTGDFAYYRLKVAAADYAGSRAGARTSVAAFEEAVVRTSPNGLSLWFGGVWVFVCVELAAAEWPRKRTYIGQRTRPRWPVYGALIL